MARERLTAAEVHDKELAAYSSRVAPRGDSGIPPGDELEDAMEIVLRAGRLGFSRLRVATALGISHDELVRIEQRNE